MRTNPILVTDFEFSTSKACERCGGSPEDYWNMVKVEDKWICINCLGRLVCFEAKFSLIREI